MLSLLEHCDDLELCKTDSFGKICKVSVRVGKVTRHVNIYMDVSSVYGVVW